MQDLQHELIAEKGLLIEVAFASPDHCGFQLPVLRQPRQLPVHLLGRLFNPQQLLAQHRFANGGGVEDAITHHRPSAVLARREADGVLQRAQVIKVCAFRVPVAVKPVGVHQILL